MDINAKTNLLCLIGNPVEHSFSPSIHNYLIKKNNLNMKYVCFNVKSDELENAIKGIKALGVKGCNVTIPHKVEIIKYLDSVDKNALLIGAVNTVKNEGGKLIGYNTDGVGFVKSITDKGYDIYNKNVLIIGAGGAARSIAIEMASNGAKEINLRNRSIKNAKEISDILIDSFGINSKFSTDQITKEDLEDIDIIINTTPIGMDKDKDSCPIDEKINLTNKDILVCDIVYNPHETKFISWAKKNNFDIVYGIDMLINQAIQGFNIWTGIYANEHGNLKDMLKNV
ncbi:hypothetical protein VN21_00110 [Paraclostridium benzoelyticum]|uniref:Shikimate dehydrogenase (NADP(+)) n=1 Tax=Paraclostridium benzoelyticum TaxID=1629550 RepID=A0A0M3DKD8_9FIRM|nr:shikimate dehydrogenase [Paraclostridium benzoelyticum]KKY01847.1 hypothetical protein VN21_06620 [Paraclostridium benzoelyticum]KKY02992.1 hypothetical protein VN21_00110 [Paraclostridium benzoelyticum]